MLLQPINDLAEICARLGVRDAVLSPGSRCAPLTLAFVRQPDIRTWTVSDERAAAFIGLGMAQQTGRPVVLVCTSGTAAYNYAPAVAEAFYQQIPLLVLTADRPPEWVDQQDGQTIRQQNIYGQHVKKSYQLPVDFTHPDAAWHANRIMNEAVLLARQFPPGPVHLNIPLREPFYPLPDEEYGFSPNIRTFRSLPIAASLPSETIAELKQLLKGKRKVLLLCGLQHPDPQLMSLLGRVLSKAKVPVVADVTSNLHRLPWAIITPDAVLARRSEELLEALAPEVLISFGGPLVSKSLKQFLRKHKPQLHFHLQPHGEVADTFQSLTHVIPLNPDAFFRQVWSKLWTEQRPDESYANHWLKERDETQQRIANFLAAAPFSDFTAVQLILDELPSHSLLHLGNSMAVRYVGLTDISDHVAGLQVFCNRGTSGIDGTLSTAVGAALTTEKLVTVLLGDLSFFYDRNALWHNYLPPNLRIIVLNNQGGGIFDIIEGPSSLPEAQEYFITRQQLTAEKAAAEFGLAYFCATDAASLADGLKQLYQAEGAALLEVKTKQETNTAVFRQYQQLRQADGPSGLQTN